MCGIAGCYLVNKKVDHEIFEQMVDIISYRGPDDRDTFYEGNLALGHRRLSIIDLSEAGHQPFHYKDRYVVVFNGEIYNYKELREELISRGCSFVSECDTEVLIAAYDQYGPACVDRFNGMWAFAVYDRKEKTVFLSRDRFGVKPLYYYHKDGSFIFASEEKQIIMMAGHRFRVNRPRLMEYMIRGVHDHTEETMFMDIMQLRGGYSMLYRMEKDSISVKRYYDLSETVPGNESFEEAAANFRKCFENAIRLRLRADVPVGYCLSGGLDSSSIVCMADSIIKKDGLKVEQESISSCFEDKRYDEQEYIDEVLKHTEVRGHKIFPQGSSVLDDLDDVLWHMDEPFGSTSMYAQWNVFKGAKEHGLTVMLDGQGADEQLAGYTGFYSVILAEYLRKFRLRRFRHELECYKKLRASTEKYVNSKKIIVEAFIGAFLPGKLQKFGKIHMFYLKQGLPFEPEDIKKTIYGIDLYPAGDSRRYILDQLKCNLSMLLHYEDRNSMAHSIESRVPFMDPELAGCAFRMPIDYKLRDGITKYVVREGLKDVLPDKIRNRYSKLGFVTPEDQWINNSPEVFRKEIEEAADVLAPLLKKERVMAWYDRIEGNVQRMDFMPWRIICASHWVKLFDLEV
ncbi:MAG: asparagine synthase (glutamine-hydrolyzing) [Lachnospiraceae bacterium]|nr:asparagine synthase (glutamine-hydrolyzing) [Lachnospiraceae bacterium]